MAANTVLSPGVGGDTIRAEDKGGFKTQVVLLDIGGLGAESLLSGFLPVSQSGTWNIGTITAVTTVSAVTSITNPVAVTGTFWQVTQPVSGTVTANAGTNLNTSLLALEAGGNLATIAGKDFATQTTLALVKAKTDNLDVALSTVATAANQATEIASLATIAGAVKAEDSVSVDADKGIPALAVRQEVLSVDTSASGDYVFLKTDERGQLWVRDGLNESGLFAIRNLLSNSLKLQIATAAATSGGFVPVEIPSFL